MALTPPHTLVAVDLFSGFGGLTKGIEDAGFTTITAADHNAYTVEVREANHPSAVRWIADLVNPEAADYHSVRLRLIAKSAAAACSASSGA
ncbi:DNA cytosine methyltransferase [Nocardia fusca]|uniref:DNA cytosine methyltransferase n=1 Tax=Nocardia fusca TaxID=941183 RepID=UPI0037B53A25